ncbi:ankyrin repeat-containing domain protein, partial [Lasiosphaeria miniovina]
MAAASGHAGVIDKLVRMGASVQAKTQEAETPLHLAAISPNALDDRKESPLHYAGGHGHASAAEILIQFGANLEAMNHEGKTPLSLAAQHGEEETVGVLLRHNADVNAMGIRGQTPLCLAIGNANLETVNALLAAGADVNATDSESQSPLHIAATRDIEDGYEIAKLLLEAGADMEVQNK